MFILDIAAIQTYDPKSGFKIDSPINFPKQGPENLNKYSAECSADFGDEYFRRGLNAFIKQSPQRKGIIPNILRSPGTAGAVCEVISGGFLWWCFKGPATLVNWGTSIGEFINVAISESEKIEKPIKEELLALSQIVAGGVGFCGFLKERLFTHKENDYSNIHILEKIGLSTSYLLNTFFMVTGAIEKSLLSMVCSNRENRDGEGSKSEYRDCLTTAKSDKRCTVECGVATLIPWIMDFGPAKFLLDVLIPYQAIRDGLATFVARFKKEKDIYFIPKKLQTPKMFELMEFMYDPRTLFGRREEKEEEFMLLWPFSLVTKFLLGTESSKGANGFRNYCIKPFYKMLGALPPDYYLNEKGKIVVVWDKQEEKQIVRSDTEQQKPKETKENESPKVISVLEKKKAATA